MSMLPADAHRRLETIDTGDHVRHGPTGGEEWVVAYVEGDRLARRLEVAQRLADALRKDLDAHDPEDFGCACAPKHVCGPCRARERQQPLRTILTEWEQTR